MSKAMNPPRDTGDLERRRTRWALGAVLVAAAALRLHALNAGLWFDEIDTLAHYARLPLGAIVSTYHSQNQHPLYSVAARFAAGAFGESAWTVRLPAVVFGVASVWATYWFGAHVAARREALLAAALLAFSHHHVWFSQNARGYTGLLLFTLIGSGLFVRMVSEPDEGLHLGLRATAYALAMSLGVYMHLTAAVVVAAHALIWSALAWRNRNEARSVNWTPAIAVVLAGLLSLTFYAPLLPQLYAGLLAPGTPTAGEVKWQNPLWLATETIRGLARGLPGGVAGLALGAGVITAGVVSYARQDRTLAAILLLPALITAVAIVALGHNLWPRFFFFSAGFAVLIAMRGLFVTVRALVPRRTPMVATLVALAVVLASATTVPAAWGPKQDYEAAWRYVESVRGPRDAVVTVIMSDLPYRNHPGRSPVLNDNPALLDCIERQHTRTWVIYTFPTRVSAVQPSIWRRLERDYRPVAEFYGTVREGKVVVLVNE